MKTCLHRFLATDPVNINNNPERCGNCHICTQDEKNKECSQYTPMSISVFDIKQSATSIKKW